ncbi:MAG: hypothetical protein U9Q03_03415 [Patescibacteria group bacterium]|nr:hypothetical protein [Patescibacteria group bacterium]
MSSSDRLTDEESWINELVQDMTDEFIPIISLMYHTFGRKHTIAAPDGQEDVKTFKSDAMTMVVGWAELLMERANSDGHLWDHNIDQATMLPVGITNEDLRVKFSRRVSPEINGGILLASLRYFKAIHVPRGRLLPKDMSTLLCRKGLVLIGDI